MRITDEYTVFYKDKEVGYYYIFSDKSVSYSTAWRQPEELASELEKLRLDKEKEHLKRPIRILNDVITEENRLPGRKRVYRSGDFRLERHSRETGERFVVYRRDAEKGSPEYSPLPHDAPHSEGPHTPEGMREWTSWYAFNKMDDGNYEAELDEAWWWGGGHNDGGTIHTQIPEEWFELPYEEFLENVVTLAAAAHYGFTAEQLREKQGLKEFFGY